MSEAALEEEVEIEPGYPKTWEDVDALLEQMANVDISIVRCEVELVERVRAVAAEYQGKLEALRESRKFTEGWVREFCRSRKAEFAKKRTKRLDFGKLSYRLAESIAVPKDKEEIAIAVLRQLGLEECIRKIEELDKPALKKLSDGDLAKCGLKREKEDHFKIEPFIDLVAERMGQKVPGEKLVTRSRKLAGSLLQAD